MYRNILIATDGSPIAETAVAHGLGLAAATGASVTVVTVTDYYPTSAGVMMPSAADVERYEKAAADAAQRLLSGIAERACALGVFCATRHRVHSLPAEGILAVCREDGCDLIVMASHGRRGIDRLLLGSQSQKVMAASTVPVLICR